MSEYRKLAKQPLVFALAEFRFSPVLEIEKFIPQIQEELRKSYPLPELVQEQAIHVNVKGVEVKTNTRWAFVAANRLSAVTLDTERLIYFTAAYPRFDGFSTACIMALEPLKNIVAPELILRIGLRYGDLIEIKDNEELEDYVDPYFGYPKMIESLGTPEHQRDEVVIRTDVGRLQIRSLYGNNNLVCLPDLQGIPGLPQPTSESSQRIVLDFDHFWSNEKESVEFDLNRVETILEKLHETAREAFWKITTDEAKDHKWT